MNKIYNSKRIGEIRFTKKSLGGYRMEVISGSSSNGFLHILMCGKTRKITSRSFLDGSVKNKFHPSMYGVGFIGEGNHSGSGIDRKKYCTWKDMLRRCYSMESTTYCPTYIDTIVCNEWFNYQNFAKWYDMHYPTDGKKYHLDKDILSSKNKLKIYSPLTCMFIPQSLNSFVAKENNMNKTGYTGVSKYCINGKYVAHVSIFGKQKTVGYYDSIHDAVSARCLEQEKVISNLKRYHSFDYSKYFISLIG